MTDAARAAGFALAVVALAAVAVAGVAVGATTYGVDEVWRALFRPADDDVTAVVREIRVPRTAIGLLVGAALGAAGTLVQTMTRNPLAEPGILGVTAGASFAIVVGAGLGVAGGQLGQLVLCLVGAVTATLAVFMVGRASPLRLVLAGTALTAMLQGITLGLRLIDPDVFDRYRYWSVGSLAGREQLDLDLPVVVVAVALVGALAVSRRLNAIALGEETAQALGVDVRRTRVLVLALVMVLAGAATAVAGPIAFVGLMVPHLSRRMAGGSVPWLMAFTVVVGALVLVAADVLARLLLPVGEVPVAVVTAFLGGPVLIWAVRRYGSESW